MGDLRHVKVERIHLRLAGLPPETAHLLAAGLGREVLEHLGRQEAIWQATGKRRIAQVTPEPIRLTGGLAPSDLRRQIAGAIALAITGAVPGRPAHQPATGTPVLRSDGESQPNG